MNINSLSVNNISCNSPSCQLKEKISSGSLITGVSYGIHNNKNYCESAFEAVSGVRNTIQLDCLTHARQ
jgi:hypothetical protein